MEALHKKLVTYAYNLLGSYADAKDVYERYESVRTTVVDNPAAYLTRSVFNQPINLKARLQRHRKHQAWLPEPVCLEQADTQLLRADAASYSMLVLLEKLNAKERDVFILKEALDYSHEEIAEVLSVRVENSRQLLSRAKDKLKNGDMAAGQRHLKAAAPQVLGEFVQALQSGDVARLEALFVNEVSVTADGGPDVQVVRQFTMGRAMSIELLLYVCHTYQRGLRVQIKEECHQPALLYFNGKTLVNCQVFELDRAGKIHHIYSIVDPEKLKNC